MIKFIKKLFKKEELNYKIEEPSKYSDEYGRLTKVLTLFNIEEMDWNFKPDKNTIIYSAFFFKDNIEYKIECRLARNDYMNINCFSLYIYKYETLIMAFYDDLRLTDLFYAVQRIYGKQNKKAIDDFLN
jgi:hypothetical protein